MKAVGWGLAALGACGTAVVIASVLQKDTDPVSQFKERDCLLRDASAAAGYVVVDCATPHEAQVFRRIELTTGSTLAAVGMSPTCFGSVAERLQAAYATAGATPSAVVSSSGTVVCLVVHDRRAGSLIDEVDR